MPAKPQVRSIRTAPASAVLARAAVAVAVGAVALGALAIGRLAIGRIVIGNARVRRLQVDELTVGRLRVRDHTGSAISLRAIDGVDQREESGAPGHRARR